MTREKFLSIAEQYYNEYESLNNSETFYDYEKSFVEFMQDFGNELMEAQLNEGATTQDRRKKKTLITRYGKISILKTQRLLQISPQNFGISPYMQELMTYAGHLDCYVKCNEILEKFTTVQVSSAQIYRVTNHISTSLSDEDNKTERILPPLSKQDVLYVEIDGSMIQTRKNEEPWKEVKLGRLFRGEDCLNPNSDAAYLQNSQYVGHFGNSTDFCKKLESIIDAYGSLNNKLVFINDVAAWIREWISDNYPNAVSVLDYYHACEYLYDFADKIFPQASSEKDNWCDQQKELLLASKVETVLDNIDSTKAKEEDKKRITTYYKNNKKRMNYKEYRDIGCGIIGSGAIESSHRTVIQKRMKQAGQRWSIKGAKNMLRLRVISMNKQWAKVIDCLKKSPLEKAA